MKYLLAATSGCSAVEATRDVVIVDLPTATIEAPVTEVCLGAANPVITFTGKNQDGTATGIAFPYTFTYRVNGGAEQTITSAEGSATANVEQSTISSGSFAYTLLNVSNVNGCAQAISGSAVATISINASRVAVFKYSNTPYCSSSSDPEPSFSHGGEAGHFTSNPALSTSILDEHTGAIDLSEITPGNYDIINTIGAENGCAEVQEHTSITIAKLPDATFHYASTTYCTSGTDPDPIFNEGGATDEFTVDPAGLNIHATTGAIDLSLSLEGIYTITRTIPAESGCQQAIATAIVEITAAPTPSTIDYSYYNSYTGNGYNYCNIQPGAFVHLTGTSGGIYTILPATGLAINASSGTLTTLGATTGSYTVTYTIPAVGGCGALIATAPVTVAEGPTIEAGNTQEVCSGSMVNLAGIRADELIASLEFERNKRSMIQYKTIDAENQHDCC